MIWYYLWFQVSKETWNVYLMDNESGWNYNNNECTDPEYDKKQHKMKKKSNMVYAIFA